MDDLNKDEIETLNEMVLGDWYYAMPARFTDFMANLEAKGYVERGECTFNRTGIKWRKVKEPQSCS